jgi:hypothetical protein
VVFNTKNTNITGNIGAVTFIWNKCHGSASCDCYCRETNCITNSYRIITIANTTLWIFVVIRGLFPYDHNNQLLTSFHNWIWILKFISIRSPNVEKLKSIFFFHQLKRWIWFWLEQLLRGDAVGRKSGKNGTVLRRHGAASKQRSRLPQFQIQKVSVR